MGELEAKEKKLDELREKVGLGGAFSPFPPEQESQFYSRVFNHLETQGIDFFVDSLIDDLRDVGEHSGRISFKGEDVLVEKNKPDEYTEQVKESLSSLRNSGNHRDLDLLRKYLSDESNGDEMLEQILENPARKDHLIDYLEFIVDARGVMSEKGDIDYHFHPISNKLSATDVAGSWFKSKLPLVFAYEDDHLIAFYYENGQHKSRKFKIRSEEKRFQLNLLTAQRLIKSNFFVLSEKSNKLSTQSFNTKGNYLSKASSYLIKAYAQTTDETRADLYQKTLKGLMAYLDNQNLYLSSFQDYLSRHNFSEVHEIFTTRVSLNKKIGLHLEKILERIRARFPLDRSDEVDKKYPASSTETSHPEKPSPIVTKEFELYVPHTKKVPKPRPHTPKQRFPWEIPIIGISTLAMIGADRYINRKQYQYRKRNR